MKITLAGKDYNFDEPFELGQVRRISTIAAKEVPTTLEVSEQMDMVWDKRLAATVVALKPIMPDVTPSSLEGMRITNQELVTAYIEIIKHAGLIKVDEEATKDGQPGEAVAEAA